MKNMGVWFERIKRKQDTLLLVESVDDIHRAKNEGKLGIIFHFQGTLAFEDDIIGAIAENGGVIGINGYPAFVSDKTHPDLEDFIDHIDYMVERAGIDHVCIGMAAIF